MKRNKFVKTLIGIAAVPLVSFKAKAVNEGDRSKGFKINAGEGRVHGHIKLKGVNANILDMKISGSDTQGDLAVFEQTSLSKGRGTPLHIHHFQDEIFYVIDGDYYFQVGDEKFRLGKGESIFLPRKVPHAWTQVSDAGKMTVILQPAGKLEEFFVTMASLDHEPTEAEIAKIFSDHDMQVVGPALKIE